MPREQGHGPSSGDITMALKAPISQLHPQLLARVLHHVPTEHRLQHCAAVCRSWHTAAVMATHIIRSSEKWGQEESTAFNSWMQAHADTLAVTEMTIVAGGRFRPFTLQLPQQLLQTLRSLRLDDTQLSLTGPSSSCCSSSSSSSHSAAGVVLPAQLSALTHLALCNCNMDLEALPAFSQLQHLLLTGYGLQASIGAVAIVAAALPKMQHLTHLTLGPALAQDSVIACMQHLTCLQVLQLQQLPRGTSAATSFAQLPASLTQLDLGVEMMDGFTFSPSATPGLLQLTALQRLTISGTASFDPALLVSSWLTHVALGKARLPGDGLTVLAKLTALERLQLDTGPRLTSSPMGFSALTASSQLTYLGLLGRVEHRDYKHVFPEGRQLPQLRELHANMGLLGNRRVACNVAAACPSLETLHLGPFFQQDPLDENAELDLVDIHMSLEGLAVCQKLTSLQLNCCSSSHLQPSWASIAKLTSLRAMYITGLEWDQFDEIWSLTALTQLTNLKVDVGGARLIVVTRKVHQGATPDVWRRLPSAALRLAADTFGYANNYGNEELAQTILSVLASAAASHSEILEARVTQQEQQLQEEVQQLQQQLSDQQAQHAAEQQQMQQQMADMQEAVAALAAQMQAMQQQQQQQQQ